MLKFAMTRGLAFAALAALALTTAARAEEPAAPAIAAATKVLSDVGMKGSVQGIALAMLGELERSVLQTHPEMKQALHETLVALAPDFVKGADGVIDDAARVFASRMTEQELKQAEVFFESPVGKKYLESQGPILQQVSASSAAWRAELSNSMLTRVRDEMKKKGYSF